MNDSDSDKNPAKIAAKEDHNEGVGLLEPLVLSTKSPLRIGFMAKLASRWMPGLFPEQRE